jgi:hypothetical protein
MTRTLIGTNAGVVSRERVFETGEGVEVDSTDQYDLSRKRVLFEDVVLITHHREAGWGHVVGHTFVALVFLSIAAVTVSAGGGWIAASIISAFALPSIITIAIRSTIGIDVVSIYGRRSRAKLRFTFRKKRARELYGRLCHRTRQAQREVEEANVAAPIAEPESIE